MPRLAREERVGKIQERVRACHQRASLHVVLLNPLGSPCIQPQGDAVMKPRRNLALASQLARYLDSRADDGMHFRRGAVGLLEERVEVHQIVVSAVQRRRNDRLFLAKPFYRGERAALRLLNVRHQVKGLGLVVSVTNGMGGDEPQDHGHPLRGLVCAERISNTSDPVAVPGRQ